MDAAMPALSDDHDAHLLWLYGLSLVHLQATAQVEGSVGLCSALCTLCSVGAVAQVWVPALDQGTVRTLDRSVLPCLYGSVDLVLAHGALQRRRLDAQQGEGLGG